MPKVVLFNGPPRSGKDTIARALTDRLENNYKVCTVKFADAIKGPVAQMFNLTDEEYDFYFETDAKDKPQDRFFGFTPRAVLISFSEEWAKKLFGEKIFGQILGRRVSLERNLVEADLVFVTDCGFAPEIEGFFEYHGSMNTGLFRVVRGKCSFKGDSRRYVDTLKSPVSFNQLLSNDAEDCGYGAVASVLEELYERGFIKHSPTELDWVPF